MTEGFTRWTNSRECFLGCCRYACNAIDIFWKLVITLLRKFCSYPYFIQHTHRSNHHLLQEDVHHFFSNTIKFFCIFMSFPKYNFMYIKLSSSSPSLHRIGKILVPTSLSPFCPTLSHIPSLSWLYMNIYFNRWLSVIISMCC